MNKEKKAKKTEEIEQPIEIKDEAIDYQKLYEDKEKELLYLRAEFDNFRKQSIKERSELIKFGAEALSRDLLSVIDVFQKALESDVNAENFKAFVEGVSLTEKELINVLDKHGVRNFECLGKAFDPNNAEALSQIPSPEHKAGEVIEVMRKGYSYHDKVLRYAQVVIAAES